jgi:DNA-binding MarR family transcriptional regulator
VKRAAERDLRLLIEISEHTDVTQRRLSKSLGIALGLTNLYLKRLARKGHIKIRTIPPNRLKYLITPKGFAEKTRLTYEYLAFSLSLYRRTRRDLREALEPLVGTEAHRIGLYGTGEAAELAYLTVKEMGLDVVAAFADGAQARFLDVPVRPTRELLQSDLDRVVVSTFDGADPQLTALLRLGLSPDKLIFLGHRPERVERGVIAARVEA